MSASAKNPTVFCSLPRIFLDIERQIASCYRQLSSKQPLGNVQIAIKSIGEDMQKAREQVRLNPGAIWEDRMKTIENSYNGLTLRFDIAAPGQREMPAPKLTLDPKVALRKIEKAFNSNNPRAHFDKLLAAISKENVNLKIYGNQPFSFTQPAEDESRFSTLSELIFNCTMNGLFSTEQGKALIQKLFDVGADFSIFDPNQGSAVFGLFNCGRDSAEFDPFLRRAILEQPQSIPTGVVQDLLACKKEDIFVLLLMQIPAHAAELQEFHLVTACQHFGKSYKERPEGIRCVEMIMDALSKKTKKRLSESTVRECFDYLTEATRKVETTKSDMQRAGHPATGEALQKEAEYVAFATDWLGIKKKYEFAITPEGKAKLAELTAKLQQDLNYYA